MWTRNFSHALPGVTFKLRLTFKLQETCKVQAKLFLISLGWFALESQNSVCKTTLILELFLTHPPLLVLEDLGARQATLFRGLCFRVRTALRYPRSVEGTPRLKGHFLQRHTQHCSCRETLLALFARDSSNSPRCSGAPLAQIRQLQSWNIQQTRSRFLSPAPSDVTLQLVGKPPTLQDVD